MFFAKDWKCKAKPQKAINDAEPETFSKHFAAGLFLRLDRPRKSEGVRLCHGQDHPSQTENGKDKNPHGGARLLQPPLDNGHCSKAKRNLRKGEN